MMTRKELSGKARLLLVGTDSTHTVNFYHLVKDYFSEIMVITSRHPQRWNDIPVIEADLSFSRPARAFGTWRLFRDCLARFQPDIIHVHQAGTPALYTLLSRKKGIPVVLTAWGSDILKVPGRSCWHHKMIQYNLRGADVITADSRHVAEEIKSLAAPSVPGLYLVNFGIPRLPATGPKENLVYSNRLHKKLYRIDRVIRAFHRFLQHEKEGDWNLVVAGQGEETPRLKNLVEDLGLSAKVDFVGFVDQDTNLDYYARAAVFISIPESDATSISLLEALAAGCRPIVSDLPANREWIQGGINGIVAENLEKDIIGQALALDYSQLVSMNLDLVKHHATREVSRQRFFSIYDLLLSSA